MPGWEIPTWWEISRRLEPWYPYSANSSAAPSRISSLRDLRGSVAGGAIPCGALVGGSGDVNGGIVTAFRVRGGRGKLLDRCSKTTNSGRDGSSAAGMQGAQ